MAGAFVDGHQGETMSGQPMTPYLKVAATAKHYALNDNENNRYADSSSSTDANIRDYCTAQFRALTEDAHVAGTGLLHRHQTYDLLATFSALCAIFCQIFSLPDRYIRCIVTEVFPWLISTAFVRSRTLV